MEEVNFSDPGSTMTSSTFPCLVCSLKTNSIEELHRHQKYYHDTEELSFSLIHLVHCVTLKNKIDLLQGMAFNAPMIQYPPLFLVQNYDKNNHNLHFYKDGCMNSSGSSSNNDCAKVYNSKEFIGANESIGQKPRIVINEIKHEPGIEMPCDSVIISGSNLIMNNYQLPVNLEMMNKDFDSSGLSNSENELNEISNDAFFKSVTGICEQLEIIDKKKKKKMKKPIQKKRRIGITLCDKKNYNSPAKRMRNSIG